MRQKKLIEPMIDALKPKRRPGALPKVTTCPYCGQSMSQTAHAAHRPACRQAFKDAPPQPADFMHDAGGGYNADLSFPQT
jgi:hypothetical protein